MYEFNHIYYDTWQEEMQDLYFSLALMKKAYNKLLKKYNDVKPPVKECKTCLYFDGDGGYRGSCTCRSPQIDSNSNNIFPKVRYNSICGEWEYSGYIEPIIYLDERY